MAPVFFYRIDSMRPNPQYPPRSSAPTQQWIPPTPLRSNLLVNESVTGNVYYYDQQQSRQIQQLPTGAASYKAFSMYYDDGEFWIVPYDATAYEVGGGPADGWIDWKPMSFTHDDPQSYTSFATYAGDQSRLRFQRQDQAWVPNLLPPHYHSFPQDTNDQRYGGMNGHLPIILGLIALSVAPNHVDAALKYCVHADQWRSWPSNVERANRRGVVVRVYIRPPTTPQEMDDFERGLYGTIYP